MGPVAAGRRRRDAAAHLRPVDGNRDRAAQPRTGKELAGLPRRDGGRSAAALRGAGPAHLLAPQRLAADAGSQGLASGHATEQAGSLAHLRDRAGFHRDPGAAHARLHDGSDLGSLRRSDRVGSGPGRRRIHAIRRHRAHAAYSVRRRQRAPGLQAARGRDVGHPVGKTGPGKRHHEFLEFTPLSISKRGQSRDSDRECALD